MTLNAVVVRPDGTEATHASGAIELPDRDVEAARTAAEELGADVAEKLIRQGARAILDAASVDSQNAPSPEAP
jgi:hypothetical protein